MRGGHCRANQLKETLPAILGAPLFLWVNALWLSILHCDIPVCLLFLFLLLFLLIVSKLSTPNSGLNLFLAVLSSLKEACDRLVPQMRSDGGSSEAGFG